MSQNRVKQLVFKTELLLWACMNCYGASNNGSKHYKNVCRKNIIVRREPKKMKNLRGEPIPQFMISAECIV